MRYFKCTEKDGYSIWITGDDGFEKCGYSSEPNRFMPMMYDWYNPETNEERSNLEMVNSCPDMWKEITEDEAFLEMV